MNLQRRFNDDPLRPIERRICMTEEQIKEIMDSMNEIKSNQHKQLGFIAGVLFAVSLASYVIEHFALK